MNWVGAPQGLRIIELDSNQISEMNWVGIPEGLETIDLSVNQISKMNWFGAPQGLKTIDLRCNQIKTKGLNWEGCPSGLTEIDLSDNQISTKSLNFKGVPWDIEVLYPYNEEYIAYKESRNNIPEVPFISDKQKRLVDEITFVSLAAPGTLSQKVFSDGGYSFRESIQDLKRLRNSKLVNNFKSYIAFEIIYQFISKT